MYTCRHTHTHIHACARPGLSAAMPADQRCSPQHILCIASPADVSLTKARVLAEPALVVLVMIVGYAAAKTVRQLFETEFITGPREYLGMLEGHTARLQVERERADQGSVIIRVEVGV